ncbi:MAG: choice-of-anchor D domain-containing protein [Bacteroidales bacterium]|nr:choice-of-anchor D domain-containing protein [Bacteroidales bacterium]
MKKNVLLIVIALLPFFGLYASSISVLDTISANTTWTGVDTVKVVGDIYVNNGITLTIAPGIFVEFQGHYKLDVQGRLLAIGTETNTITFTATNHSTGWNRIIFDGTPDSNDSTKIVYCQLEYGKANSGQSGNLGGAIYVYFYNKLLISHSSFSNNDADWWGGAIYCEDSDIEIKYCDFNNNSCGTLGGGICITNCEPVLVNNIIRNNSASTCGGILFDNSNAILINNTIVNNSWGGVWCHNNSDPIFRNTIIYGNSGDEVYLDSNSDDPNFYYCDIEGGTSGFGGPGSGANYTGDYDNCIETNPQFVNSGDHPFDLSNSSPCINAGDPSTTTGDVGEYDLAGNPRIQYGIIDIGAYEAFQPDNFPGTALKFNGIDDYVSVPSNTSLNTPQFTVEFWVAMNNPGNWQGILDKGRNTNNDWYFLTGSPGQTEGVIFGIGNGSSRHEISYSWYDTLWHHVAGTYDGTTMKLYVDGVLCNYDTHSFSSTTNNITFGIRHDQSWPFEGKIDEIAIWNDALTVTEIREKMHLALSGSENGLVSYWQFNEGSGIIANELINNNNGTLNNMTDDNWIESTIPLGSGTSITQIVSDTGIETFPGTGLSMNFTAKSGTDTISVTRIDTVPNLNPTSTGTIFDEQYWVVNRFGNGTFTVSLTFTLNEDLTTCDENKPSQINLYTRSSTADTAWSFLMSASSVKAANDEATFEGITGFSQFIIGRQLLPPDGFPGTALEFDGTDDFVETTINDLSGSEITIEYWFKGSSTHSAVRQQSGSNYIVAGWNDLHILSNDGGTGNGIPVGDGAEDGNWHHIAMTWKQNTTNGFTSYLDGNIVGQRTSIDAPLPNINANVIFGSKYGTGEFMTGSLEEIRIWNVARDSFQIRENMHLTLTGLESGSVSYWQFNEGSGETAYDYVSGKNGTLTNMDTINCWINSTIPFGDGISNTQTETAGNVDFTNTGLSMYFNSQSGAEITTTRIDTIPNINPVGLLTTFNSQYWAINRFGDGIFNADLTFAVNEDLTIEDQSNPDNIGLFKRNSNSDEEWSFVKSAFSVNPVDDKVTFTGITEFCQYIIGRGLIPDIEVDPETIDYRGVLIGVLKTEILTISNTGADTLFISDITTSNSDFSVDTTICTILPDESHDIQVTFTPSTLGVVTDTLTIFSDDPDAPAVNITLTGEGLETDAFPGNALEFDGVNDYVSIAQNSELPIYHYTIPEFTISMWVKGNGQDDKKVFSESNSDCFNNLFTIGTTDEGKVRVFIRKMNGTVVLNQVSSNIAFDNTWHHIAWVVINGNQKLYIDGVQDPSNFHYYIDGIVLNRTSIGAILRSYPSNFFEGIIDEVQIWEDDLSATQIRENMYITLSGTEPGLVSYFQLNEGSGNATYDLISENNGTLINMEPEDWINSTLPTGGGESNTQTEAAGIVDFAGTDLSMYYNSQNGASVTVTRIDTIPNINPTNADTVFDAQYWVVNRFGNGTFDVDLTFTISEDLTAEDETYPSQINLYTRGSNADTNWVYLTDASSVNAANDQATFEGITEYSQFIIIREKIIILDLIAFLEGPYDSITGLMLPDLNPDELPLSQPYNTAPWNYTGTESVASIPNTDVIDWVLIELRDTTDASLATGETMIAQQAAFILNDGDIVGLDGSSILSFNHSIIHSLFVVIWHRNHLGIMSANAVTETGGIYTYDFTTGAGQIYGDANGHKEIGAGVWGMIGGDGDANSQIGNADKNDVWAVQAGTSGYLSGDFTMDVQVNNSDKNDVWAQNSGKGGQVPDNIPQGGFKCMVPE